MSYSGISGQSERLKDDGRFDVSITVCYQLKVTIGFYQMVEASEIQSRTETVATMVLGEYRDDVIMTSLFLQQLRCIIFNRNK